jgi:NH3-dependent NAD+ synthetase
VLDEIVDRHVERRQTAARIIAETGFDAAIVQRICRLIDRNEYKRRQMATGLKVTTVAFGPGRRVPIARGWHENAS